MIVAHHSKILAPYPIITITSTNRQQHKHKQASRYDICSASSTSIGSSELIMVMIAILGLIGQYKSRSKRKPDSVLTFLPTARASLFPVASQSRLGFAS